MQYIIYNCLFKLFGGGAVKSFRHILCMFLLYSAYIIYFCKTQANLVNILTRPPH